MSRYRMTIAYDGRGFGGWQSQPGENTIQDRIQAAFASLGFSGIRVHGSGRTDAGVHAQGQVAHFDAPEGNSMEGDNWLKALNTRLPDSIRVRTCEGVEPDFHARFQAKAKTYRYRLHLAEIGSPFEAGRVWRIGGDFDQDLFSEAARSFLGEHDFVAFAANRGNPEDEPESTVRRIDAVVVAEGNCDGASADSGILEVSFTGNGFLYKMVRLMVGALVRVAQGKESMAWLQSMIDAGSRAEKCRFCAPGDGLCLMRVDYQ